MTMETLPTEVLTQILQYLPPIDRIRSEQVCRRWRDISRSTWKDIKELFITNSANYDDDGEFEDCPESQEFVKKEGDQLFIGLGSRKMIRCLVSRVGYFIEKLHFDTLIVPDNKRIDYSMMILFFCSYCRNLKALTVGTEVRTYVEVEWWSVLFDCNPKLHSVMYGFGENLMEALPLRNWRSLRFTSAEDDNEEKIISLIEHSEALEEFESNVFTTPIIEAVQKLRNLRSLYYTVPEEGPSPEMIFDVSMLNRLRNLNFTDMKYHSYLLEEMLPHCCQLKSLCINSRFDYEFPVSLLEEIMAISTLETLEIAANGIGDDILIHFTKLRSFSIRDKDESVTNEGIIDMIKKSEILENLDIKFTHVTVELFETLVTEMSDRQKYLNVMVPCRIFDEVSKICAGTKIRLMKYIRCFQYDY